MLPVDASHEGGGSTGRFWMVSSVVHGVCLCGWWYLGFTVTSPPPGGTGRSDGLFGRVGLHTNVNKTVGMICQPCQMSGGKYLAE